MLMELLNTMVIWNTNNTGCFNKMIVDDGYEWNLEINLGTSNYGVICWRNRSILFSRGQEVVVLMVDNLMVLVLEQKA